MKTKIRIISLSLMLSIGAWITPQKTAAQVSVSFQVFYDDLSPYGYWVDNPDYGYVWSPDVSDGFTPYGTNGYWVFTDEGWTWVSNYSWGWAPFHYGRWFYEPGYGWLWAPDNEWGPGWVSWRRSDDYYGWAPMGPGISIDITYSSGYSLPYNQWTFVRNRDFGRPNINNYYINNSNNITIINNTTVINNTRVDRTRNVRYNAGPDRTEVERRAGRRFTPVAIKESNKPGQRVTNNQFQIYRPRVEKNNNAVRKPSPSKVVRIEDVKTSNRRTEQPNRQQPEQPKRIDQPTRQQPQQPKRIDQPTRQEPQRPKRNDKPTRQEPQQPKRIDKPTRQEPQQPKRIDKPTRQEPQQPKRIDQPTKQQPQQPKKENPRKKVDG